MPRRADINSILILGAGPIIIGQACEFDYSGAQACQALKEEGYRVILVNSNPATIMTDPSMADATYIEPVKWRIIEKIIEKENENLSKFIGQPESELKIVMGNPDDDINNDKGTRFLIYKSKKYTITCERKFEVDKERMVIGFSSKGCF